jgi:hypothetical protein
MAVGQQDETDPQEGPRIDEDVIAHVFRPLLQLHRNAQSAGDAASDGPEADSVPSASDAERNRTAHLLVAVSALWDAVLVGAGVDLSEPFDQGLAKRRHEWGFSGYADDMLTYELCNSIWKWNQLGTARPTDDLDRMIARALVRIRDVMSALERRMDIDKRTDEAMANLIHTRPATVEAMLDEARYRHLCPDIVELVVGSQC